MASRLLILFTLLLPSLIMSSQSTLEDLRWEHRVLIFCGSNSSMVDTQILAFSDQEADISDRKLTLFRKEGNTLKNVDPRQSPVNVSERLQRSADLTKPLSVFLIGLDGGIKKVFNRLVTPQEIYGIIDGMPMRKSEMRRDHGGR